jgi:hypothetical protein
MTTRAPVKAVHQFARALHPSLSILKDAMTEVDGFNAKFAVLITRLVGTMWCAYLFTLIALLSLPDILITAGVLPKSSVPSVLANPGLILIVAWVAQTFIQLVLLSVIMVGQNVQSLAADARAANTFSDVETILDRLDVHTQGGLKEVVDRIEALAGARGAPGGAAAAEEAP